MSQVTAFQSNINYQVMARRLRPQLLGDLVGQEAVSQSLRNIIVSGKIPHAFLFTGTRGTGKTTTARILAKSICCVGGPTATPCLRCHHCVQIAAGAHEDVLEIDGASNTGVDNVRELRDAARFFPNSARFKVFIIDEVHMLSMGAFNALLKTLEEPPPQVVFILATTELHKVPVTVRSRCMVFAFRKASALTIEGFLKGVLTKEGVLFDEQALRYIAREANGSFRDSLSLLEQAVAASMGSRLDKELVKNILSLQDAEMAMELLSHCCSRDTAAALGLLKKADAVNVDLATLLEATADTVKKALILKSVSFDLVGQVTELLPDEVEHLSKVTGELSAAALAEMFRVFLDAAKDAAKSSAPLSWAEMGVIDAISRSEWMGASELVSSLAAATDGKETAKNVQSVLVPKVETQDLRRAAGTSNTSVSTNTASISANAVTPAAVKMELLGGFIRRLESTSPTLSSKLKHVIFKYFDEKNVEVAALDANKFYAEISLEEAGSIVAVLKAMGVSPVVRGFYGDGAKTFEVLASKTVSQAAANPAPLSDMKRQRSLLSFLLPPESSEVVAVDPVANVAATASRATEEKKNLSPNNSVVPNSDKFGVDGSASLAAHVKREKLSEFEEKKHELLSRPELKKLLMVATEVKVVPLSSVE